MDEFILQFTLHRLQSQIDGLRSVAEAYFDQNDANLAAMDQRVLTLETTDQEINGSINSLRDQLDSLASLLNTTIGELNKTKLVNIKQDILLRTMHNEKIFDAYDMYVDTFSNGDGVDWVESIRAELMTDFQAVGRTFKSVVEVQQTKNTSAMLISKNGSSDEAFTQSFRIDKAKELDKVSVFLEPFDNRTLQAIYVSITAIKGGPPLTQITLQPGDCVGWLDLDIPNVQLVDNTDYYIDIRTNDIYGYKIGVDTADNYLPGTSFSLFGGVWTDNNFDIAFKVWCFPSADENNATIVTVPKMLSTEPTRIVFEREETVESGGINYYVSRDGGAHWKILQPGIETDLTDLPSGKALVIKAYIMSNARVNAWGYVVMRGES